MNTQVQDRRADLTFNRVCSIVENHQSWIETRGSVMDRDTRFTWIYKTLRSPTTFITYYTGLWLDQFNIK